ncbi:hypothetical protein D3C72_451690 [compost metagenome]
MQVVGAEIEPALFHLAQVETSAGDDPDHGAVIDRRGREDRVLVGQPGQIGGVIGRVIAVDAGRRLRRLDEEVLVQLQVFRAGQDQRLVRKIFDPIFVCHVVIGDAQLQRRQVVGTIVPAQRPDGRRFRPQPLGVAGPRQDRALTRGHIGDRDGRIVQAIADIDPVGLTDRGRVCLDQGRRPERRAPAAADQQFIGRPPGQADLGIGGVARIRIAVVTNGGAQIERLHEGHAHVVRHDRHENFAEGRLHIAIALGEARNLIVARQVQGVLRLQIELVARIFRAGRQTNRARRQIEQNAIHLAHRVEQHGVVLLDEAADQSLSPRLRTLQEGIEPPRRITGDDVGDGRVHLWLTDVARVRLAVGQQAREPIVLRQLQRHVDRVVDRLLAVLLIARGVGIVERVVVDDGLVRRRIGHAGNIVGAAGRQADGHPLETVSGPRFVGPQIIDARVAHLETGGEFLPQLEHGRMAFASRVEVIQIRGIVQLRIAAQGDHVRRCRHCAICGGQAIDSVADDQGAGCIGIDGRPYQAVVIPAKGPQILHHIVTLAAWNAVVLVPRPGEHGAAASPGLADHPIDNILIIQRVGVAGRDLGPVVVATCDVVDHAGHSVRAIDGRGAVGDDLDPLDGGEGNEVGVGHLGVAALGHDASAVEQDQGGVVAQSAKVDAGGAAARRGQGRALAGSLRQAGDQGAGVARRGLDQVFTRHADCGRPNRSHPPDGRAGDDDVLDLNRLFWFRLGFLLLSQSRTGRQKSDHRGGSHQNTTDVSPLAARQRVPLFLTHCILPILATSF